MEMRRQRLARWPRILKALEVLYARKITRANKLLSRSKPGWCNTGNLFQGVGAAIALLAAALLAGGCAMTNGGTPNPGNPQATVSPSSLDFGDQDIGTTSNSLSVTLTNTGGSDLVVSGVSTSPSQFAAAGLISTTVAPGKQTVYSITFSPAAAQVYSGALNFTTNSGATTSVPLAGRGRKRASISPASLSFANQVVNTTSAPQTVTVTNSGGSNLVINSVTISPSQFALTGPSST